MIEFLQETYYFDYQDGLIQKLIHPYQNKDLPPADKAAKWYLKVRDQWRYDPFCLSFKGGPYRASEIAKRDSAHCIYKAILYIAGLRALEIPARLRLAKVKNHIAVEGLLKKLGTNELSPHAMAELYINGRWMKASPAFNKELCQMYNVAPLDFDGQQDSVFQEYTNDGQAFMEYLEDYGYYADVPLDFITKNWRQQFKQDLQMVKINEEEVRII